MKPLAREEWDALTPDEQWGLFDAAQRTSRIKPQPTATYVDPFAGQIITPKKAVNFWERLELKDAEKWVAKCCSAKTLTDNQRDDMHNVVMVAEKTGTVEKPSPVEMWNNSHYQQWCAVVYAYLANRNDKKVSRDLLIKWIRDYDKFYSWLERNKEKLAVQALPKLTDEELGLNLIMNFDEV